MNYVDKIMQFVNSLPEDERDESISHIIENLLGERLSSGQTVEIHRPDGSLLGVVHPMDKPLETTSAIMRERARRITPGSGHATKRLIEAMESHNEKEVVGFIK